ncbi:hypothetical protein GWK47_045909 [Chionoecetes opilio]|uniref:Uncharacterized protein n=1 Tax=Chionoecetes opilio TaxID=41210 RepID=A0A8J4YF25_CHIOP|nr:hypothetical protein GWK47_045909 [Chionoecetes opilio]
MMKPVRWISTPTSPREIDVFASELLLEGVGGAQRGGFLRPPRLGANANQLTSMRADARGPLLPWQRAWAIPEDHEFASGGPGVTRESQRKGILFLHIAASGERKGRRELCMAGVEENGKDTMDHPEEVATLGKSRHRLALRKPKKGRGTHHCHPPHRLTHVAPGPVNPPAGGSQNPGPPPKTRWGLISACVLSRGFWDYVTTHLPTPKGRDTTFWPRLSAMTAIGGHAATEQSPPAGRALGELLTPLAAKTRGEAMKLLASGDRCRPPKTSTPKPWSRPKLQQPRIVTPLGQGGPLPRLGGPFPLRVAGSPRTSDSRPGF